MELQLFSAKLRVFSENRKCQKDTSQLRSWRHSTEKTPLCSHVHEKFQRSYGPYGVCEKPQMLRLFIITDIVKHFIIFIHLVADSGKHISD